MKLKCPQVEFKNLLPPLFTSIYFWQLPNLSFSQSCWTFQLTAPSASQLSIILAQSRYHSQVPLEKSSRHISNAKLAKCGHKWLQRTFGSWDIRWFDRGLVPKLSSLFWLLCLLIPSQKILVASQIFKETERKQPLVFSLSQGWPSSTWLGIFPKHLQHPCSDGEATHDVDAGQEDRS